MNTYDEANNRIAKSTAERIERRNLTDPIRIFKMAVIEEYLTTRKNAVISENKILVVSYEYILKHAKARMIIQGVPDLYYELTYNSDKNEVYLDEYNKIRNVCIKL